MRKLILLVRKLQKGEIGGKIQKRLAEFKALQNRDSDTWFEELCFCLLAANARSKTSWAIQKELGAKGFLGKSREELVACILRNKHRFHNVKAGYIIEARKFADIKKHVLSEMKKNGEIGARDWLVENIKGFGYKEGSHYLRNMGFFNFAVLDRHILGVMAEHGLIPEVPTSMNPKKYLLYEKEFQKLARKMNMTCGELDFYFWYMRAGDVLK